MILSGVLWSFVDVGGLIVVLVLVVWEIVVVGLSEVVVVLSVRAVVVVMDVVGNVSPSGKKYVVSMAGRIPMDDFWMTKLRYRTRVEYVGTGCMAAMNTAVTSSAVYLDGATTSGGFTVTVSLNSRRK